MAHHAPIYQPLHLFTMIVRCQNPPYVNWALQTKFRINIPNRIQTRLKQKGLKLDLIYYKGDSIVTWTCQIYYHGTSGGVRYALGIEYSCWTTLEVPRNAFPVGWEGFWSGRTAIHPNNLSVVGKRWINKETTWTNLVVYPRCVHSSRYEPWWPSLRLSLTPCLPFR